MSKGHYLGQLNFFNLNEACKVLHRTYGPFVYLVGSSLEKVDYRDVDVRQMLEDVVFDRMFPAIEKEPHRDAQYNFLNAAISEWLHQRTSLPIDFQFQKFTAANEEFKGKRNAIGVNYDVGV